VTETVEYNKIHAMAYARKLVMQKFGSNLLYFWPMADDSVFIRDLMRQKPLCASGVGLQQPGMLDYSIDLQSAGYISDVTPDRSIGGSQSSTSLMGWRALQLTPGIWRALRLYFNQYSTSSDINLYVAPSNLSPASVPSQAIMSQQLTKAYGAQYIEWTLPYVLNLQDTSRWLYYSSSDGEVSYSNSGAADDVIKEWTGSAWTASTFYWRGNLFGLDAATWPSYDTFTVELWVDRVDTVPWNGTALAIADATEAKARLYVTSAQKVEGTFKNTNGDLYTPASTRTLHPGFNLLTLSYQKGVAVKLGVNGVVVDTRTPSNYGLFNTALALGIGAQMLTGKTTSGQLKNALVDDVFLAKGVVTDADLWDIYMSYLTAAPLMQVEGAEKVVLS